MIYTEGEGVTFPEDAVEKYSDVVETNLPKYWYQIKDAYNIILLEQTSENDFVNAISNLNDGETLQLQNNIVMENTLFTIAGTNKSVELDLNGYDLELNYKATISLTNENNLILRNGNVYLNNANAANSNIEVTSNSSITLENVNFNSVGTGIYPRGDAAQVNVINSKIDSSNSGAYGIGTNAAEVENYNVVINVENSEIINSKGSGVLLNVPGQYYFKNTTIWFQKIC